MLAAAVDAREGLLMEQDLQPELGGLAVHDLHETNVAVTGHIGRAEDGGHLVLPGGHLNREHKQKTWNSVGWKWINQ